MMFTSLMQRTKKIIQEKYLKIDNEISTTPTMNGIVATDEQLDEKSLEMKEHIFGLYCLFVRFLVNDFGFIWIDF